MSSEISRSRLVLLLFFLSGATGLLYQVVWIRLFVHTFGATVLAVSTVLAAFMGGLAAGGLWGGRIASRQERPLRTYGLLELALAVYAGLVPLILTGADPLYRALYPALGGSFWVLSTIRFLVSALILLPPTFLMGATLPLLVAHAERAGGPVRPRIAHLYATNTFGAVAGTAIAGFVLLPGLGLTRTLVAGVTLNLVVALAAILLGRRAPPAAQDEQAAEPDGAGSIAPPLPRPLLLVTAGVLGFSALAFEVLWTRTLALALGTTTYAFAIVLTVFLAGIAGGSLLASRLLRNPGRAAWLFRTAPAAVGLLALVLLPVFDRLPALFLKLSAGSGGTWGESLVAKFVVAAVPLLLPTLISGAAFPLAVGIDRAAAGPSRSTGDVYAANTLGAILGSWTAGFLLIPVIGVRGGIVTAAVLPVLVTAVMLLVHRGRSAGGARLGAVAIVAGMVALVLVLPDWDRSQLTRGGFALGVEARRAGERELPEDRSELLFFDEGVTTTVTVRRSESGEHTMQMNGITEASERGDQMTQTMAGALAVILHPDPRDVLVIGLGSGVTAAAAARHPGVERVVCVEISEAVVRGARYFEGVNRGILTDPRAEILVADGRNHLRLSEETWDCIVSHPSNVWNSGISALMTREFFGMARERLRPGGVFCSWIQGYSLSAEALKSVIAAAHATFPRVSLWMAGWGDFLIVAGDESFSLDAALVLEKGRHPEIGQILVECNAPDLLMLVSHVLVAGEALDRWLGDFPPNTDDNLFLEFEGPKLLYRDTISEMFGELHGAAGGEEELLTNAPPGLVAQIPVARRARALETEGRLAFREQRGADGIAALEEAVRLLPRDHGLARLLAGALSARGLASANRGDVQSAADDFLRAADLDPAFGEPFASLARLYRDSGKLDTAQRAIDEALAREPDRAEFLALAGSLQVRRRQYVEARATVQRALSSDPEHLDGLIVLGDALAGLGDQAAADSVWKRAAALHPDSDELVKRLRVR